MDDAALRQQYRINAMHGHDVGVWVGEGSGLSLGPCLFMQAICPLVAPRPLLTKWKQTGSPPRNFRKTGTLGLIYSECGRLPPWPYHLHLFAPQAPIARAFEQESALQDWSLAVPIIGIVVIFDLKYDRPPGALSLSRLIPGHTPHTPKLNQSLNWAQRQHVPYVIAALGDQQDDVSEQQFRQRYEIAPGIPILFGPALVDGRRQNAPGQGAETGGMFSSMFERQKLAIDRDYARVVLDALFQQVTQER